jgi:Fe-S-cluster-containing dehydrogenase component
VKCDLCRERREHGFLTSCEQHCIGGAITSCSEKDLASVIAGYPYRWSAGSVVYISKKRSDLGKKLT